MTTETGTQTTYTIGRGYTPAGKLRWIVYRDGAYYASGTTERQAANLVARFLTEDAR